jgi:hypothetical protein
MVQPSSSWRTVEGELAELTSDSLLGRQTAGGARSREPRALTFEAPHLVIEVEVVPAPAPAYSTSSSLRSGRDPGPPGRGDQDGRGDVNGRFQLEDLEARPISLRLHLPRRPRSPPRRFVPDRPGALEPPPRPSAPASTAPKAAR